MASIQTKQSSAYQGKHFIYILLSNSMAFEDQEPPLACGIEYLGRGSFRLILEGAKVNDGEIIEL